jgi:ribulose bisphosphate carboxylase small subunit
MFRKTDPQRSLLECEFLVPPEKAERLKHSWAEPFRQRVLPLIDEEVFRDAFSETMGRPNKSIRLMTCLHLLKEWNDLTDEQVLEQLEYNLQWQYALGITAEEAHTCQKSMHNYRVLLMEVERARKMFERVTRALAEADGLNLGLQRLDSTHVLSNIAVLTRLSLFVETVTSCGT